MHRSRGSAEKDGTDELHPGTSLLIAICLPIGIRIPPLEVVFTTLPLMGEYNIYIEVS